MTEEPGPPPSTSRRGPSAAVIVAGAVALVLIGLAVGRIGTDRDDVVRPVDSGAPALASEAGDGGSRSVAVGDARATVSASGRGIGIDALVVGLRRVTVDDVRLSVPGELADGRTGFLRSSPGRVTVEGSSFALDGTMLVRPDGVTFATASLDPAITTSSPVTVTGKDLVFDLGGGQRGPTGRVTFTPSTEIDLTHGVGSDGRRWIDAPARLAVRKTDGRGSIDWAGAGTVRVGRTTYRNAYGRLAGRDLDVDVRRGAGTVTATGRAVAEQVYLDGAPRLRTTATVDLVRPRVSTPAGQRAEVVWAPRNLGRFDMAMTRIRPASDAAAWIHLGLQRLPSTFGGVQRRALGGDTTGFIGGGGIASIITPGQADRRDITVDVPAGTAPGTYEALVRIEGNFDPVEARFEIDVT